MIVDFLKKILNLIPSFLSILIIGILFFLIYKNNLELLRILAWPLTLFLLVISFRKVFNYLFFSLRKFNFFGFGGELKDPEEVIKEEVNKRFIEEKGEKERQERQKLSKEELEKITDDLYEENLYLKNENNSLQAKLGALEQIFLNIRNLSINDFMLAGVYFNATTTPSDASIDLPKNDFAVWQNITTIATRAVILNRISFKKTGSVANSDIQNFKLCIDGVKIGSIEQNLDNDGYITFDLSTPYRMETGARTIKLLADIKGGSSLTFQFHLWSSEDVSFTDTQYNIKLLPTVTNANTPFTKRSAGTNGMTVN